MQTSSTRAMSLPVTLRCSSRETPYTGFRGLHSNEGKNVNCPIMYKSFLWKLSGRICMSIILFLFYLDRGLKTLNIFKWYVLKLFSYKWVKPFSINQSICGGGLKISGVPHIPHIPHIPNIPHVPNNLYWNCHFLWN